MYLSTRDLELRLRDYQLTTAEIFYHFPDHPSLLQTHIWQEMDLSPKFPCLKKFLGFWESELDRKIHSFNVTQIDCITPADYHALRIGHDSPMTDPLRAVPSVRPSPVQVFTSDAPGLATRVFHVQ